MPLYDYACDSCNLVAEAFFKMADKPVSLPCPDCPGTLQGTPENNAFN